MNSTMLRTYFRRLGFGKKTGVALPDEARGSLGFRYETEIYNHSLIGYHVHFM